MTVDEAGVARLRGFLAQIVDRRALRGRRYPLPYLLAPPLTAMTSEHAHAARLVSRAAADLSATDRVGALTIGSGRDAAEPVVLLLRTGCREFGPLPEAGTEHPAGSDDDAAPTFQVIDGAGLGLPTEARVTVHEWRCLPRRGTAGAPGLGPASRIRVAGTPWRT